MDCRLVIVAVDAETATMSGHVTAPRLFVDADLCGGEIQLNADQSHYLIRVMRKGGGDPVRLFNGRDGEWSATVTEARKRVCRLTLVEQTRAQQASPDVWLCFAPIKKARLDFLVEKATELGASRLIPVITGRTESRRVNADRLRATTIEAAEVCERLDIPEILEPRALAELLADWPGGRTLVFLDETGAGQPLPAVLQDLGGNPAAMLIGPEGGFEPAELGRLRASPETVAAALGPRLLRAETAAVAALAVWQAVSGDCAQIRAR